jgi:hypothetical protein
MNHLFVLGYNGADYFDGWYDREQFHHTKLYYIDNGKQNLSDNLKKDCIYVTTKNIGCAGGWNLMADMAYNTFNLDKFIICQEDSMISEEILDAITYECNENTICGSYNSGFEFAVFGLHKKTYEKLGRFDENILFAGCEDDDYKHRCRLHNVTVKSMEVSNKYNISIANNNNVKPRETSIYNGEYVKEKWGSYKFSHPFNIENNIPEQTLMFKKYYPNTIGWPSQIEYQIFSSK